MKNSLVLTGLVAGAAMLTGSIASAADAARAPTSATAHVISSFVDRYAARELVPATRKTATEAAMNPATDVTLYPTADREVAFLSFRIAGTEHIALAETHGGRVTRFTDFAGARPRSVPVAIGPARDAQAQARSILSPTPSAVSATSGATPDRRRVAAQEQAADVLRFASVTSGSGGAASLAARKVPRAVGDSNQLARAFMISSSGE